MAEWRHLNLHSGSLDRLPFLHSYEDQRPGNEGPFYCNRGIHPDEVKPTPENAPCVANAMLEALAHHNHRQSKARDCQEYQWQQDNTESPMADFPSPTPVDRDEPMNLEGLKGTTAAPSPSSSATTVPPPSSSTTSVPTKKKISIQEYNRCKAAEQQWASTYLDRDENREDLDYEDFELQDDPANFQIGYWTPMPIPQISDLPPLQDASTLVHQPATTLTAPNVTIPMPQDSTGPGTISGMTAHHVATSANQAPGFGRGLPVARALPMQVRTPAASASPMQVSTPVASLYRTPGHGFTTEEALLQGAILPCTPWQEAHLLNPLLTLTDNHIKMMDALCHLDSYSLQFICESAEVLRRERTPTQAPPGYRMPQVLDTLRGMTSHPPLSQEFYRATSNVGTAIVEPQQTPPQQHSMGSCRPDPEIESTVTNMQRHEQVLSTLPTDSNNNPSEGMATAAPFTIPPRPHSKQLPFIHMGTLRNSEEKTKDSRFKTIAHSLYCHTICICIFVSLLFGFLYLCTACVLFRVPCKYFCMMQ